MSDNGSFEAARCEESGHCDNGVVLVGGFQFLGSARGEDGSNAVEDGETTVMGGWGCGVTVPVALKGAG